jgi:hypothetical protein
VDIRSALVIIERGDKDAADEVRDTGVALVPELLYFLPAHLKVKIPLLFRGGFVFFVKQAVSLRVDVTPELRVRVR